MARSSAEPSPTYAEPCIVAHTCGCSAASRPIRDRVCGVQGTYQSMGVSREPSSIALMAPTRLSVVVAGTSPT